MSFKRDSLDEINTRIRGDMVSEMEDVPVIRKGTVLSAIARGVAGAAYMAYGFLHWIYKQVFPDTANAANVERHAGFHGITRREAATASGTVTISGSDGAVLPSGASLITADGVELVTTAEAIMAGGGASVAVEGAAPGATANLAADVSLTVVSPPPGVTAAVVAGAGITGGANEQTTEQLLAQLLLHLRQPPHGGNVNDYRQWTVEAGVVTDVNRVWVTRGEMGIGTVTVRFTVDDAPHGPAPTAEERETVRAYVETQRPVCAHDFFVPELILAPVDFTLSVTPDTPEVRAAVEAELAGLFEVKGEPSGGMKITHIGAAISGAPGEEDHELTSPVANIPAVTGAMPVLGTVTFV